MQEDTLSDVTLLAAKKLREAISHLSHSYKHDELFEQKRAELQRLCEVYAHNPLNPDFLEKGARLIVDFEEIASDNKASKTTSDRARVNAVVTASRVRRTHYASYLAGKYSSDKNIGSDFKCWVYNAAAFSAIQLRKAIADGVENLSKDNLAIPQLSAFAKSAIDEANMYLHFADDHCKNSVLTRFNKAVLEIYSEDKDRIRLAMEILRNLEVPTESDSSAYLTWHANNYDCYIDPYFRIEERLKTEDGNAADEIRIRLLKNKEEANRIGKVRDQRGGRWEKESPKNLALVGCAIFGSAVAASVFLSPEAQQVLMDIISSTGDLLDLTMGDGGVAQIAMGDGSVAAMDDGGIAGQVLAQVAFGDGGIA